jgi:hypothetical protein
MKKLLLVTIIAFGFSHDASAMNVKKGKNGFYMPASYVFKYEQNMAVSCVLKQKQDMPVSCVLKQEQEDKQLQRSRVFINGAGPQELKDPNFAFYAQPSVYEYIERLHNEVTRGNNSIIADGRSTGAGTVLNSLAKLAHYDQNKDYFQSSVITSSKDAENIIKAVNNGAITLEAPLLNLKKSIYIGMASKALSAVTIGGAVAAGCYGAALLDGGGNQKMVGLATVGAGALVYCGLKDRLKDMSARAIVRYGAPLIYKNFDPNHIDPLEAAEQLRGKFTCPIFMQFYAQDGVLENPDEDTIKLYNSLKNNKTHINISVHGSHNIQVYGVKNAFNHKYFGTNQGYSEELLQQTQPSTDNELRELIKVKDEETKKSIDETKKWKSRGSKTNFFLVTGVAFVGASLAALTKG